jgi:DNA-binding Lrp family transcriptional regulator
MDRQKIEIDDIDNKILHILIMDARASLKEIAGNAASPQSLS